MPDIVPPDVRSRMMSGIKGRDTKPELLLRRGLHKLGFRYRLHDRRLPGKPDLVFPRYRAVIFVNGCFWHGHSCHLFKWPSTRPEFWNRKINRNRELDMQNLERLGEMGWRTAIVWECALKGKFQLGIEEVISICSTWITSDIPFLEIKEQYRQ